MRIPTLVVSCLLLALSAAAATASDGEPAPETGGADVETTAPDEALVGADPVEGGYTPQSITLWTIYNAISSVQNRVDSISSRMPNRPEIRALMNEVPLEETIDLLKTMQREIGGVVDTARELREGFADWEDGACGGESLCKFRSEMGAVLDDMEEAWEATQRLSCVEDPSVEILPLEGFEEDGLLRVLLLERAPAVVLYGMQRTLDLSPGWQTRIREILDRIPEPLASFCDNGTATAGGPANTLTARAMTRDRSRLQAVLHPPVAPQAAGEGSGPCVPEAFPGARPCCELRQPGVKEDLTSVRVNLRLALLGYDLVDANSSDDKQVTAGATAVAGGTAGANVKNPINGSVKTLKLLTDKLDKVVDKLLTMRTECLATESQIEHDLADCALIAAYSRAQDEGGRFEEVADVVERRIDELCCEDCCSTARADLESAKLSAHFPTLCDAYEKITTEE